MSVTASSYQVSYPGVSSVAGSFTINGATVSFAPGSPLLALERTYFDRKGMPIEYTEMFCRPDKQRQIVELMRSTP